MNGAGFSCPDRIRVGPEKIQINSGPGPNFLGLKTKTGLAKNGLFTLVIKGAKIKILFRKDMVDFSSFWPSLLWALGTNGRLLGTNGRTFFFLSPLPLIFRTHLSLPLTKKAASQPPYKRCIRNCRSRLSPSCPNWPGHVWLAGCFSAVYLRDRQT